VGGIFNRNPVYLFDLLKDDFGLDDDAWLPGLLTQACRSPCAGEGAWSCAPPDLYSRSLAVQRAAALNLSGLGTSGGRAEPGRTEGLTLHDHGHSQHRRDRLLIGG
jgi:hypothetical protein